jgi:hypothetical protein
MYRKIFYFIFILAICINGFAQIKITITKEKEGDKTVIYARNYEYCPVSVLMDITLNNMLASEDINHKIFVIPQDTAKHKLFELVKIVPGKSSYAYKYTSILGDANLKTFDRNYAYDLPYKKGLEFKIGQGYFGTFSHQNERSLDFDMPYRTEILAAREGIIVSVIQNNTATCLSEACKKLANYIIIYHADGSFAEYAHLLFNGALVKVGDTVKKGQIIGLSGSTGYTKGPHLHFACFLPSFEGKKTVATKFKVGDGSVITTLTEKESYKRLY